MSTPVEPPKDAADPRAFIAVPARVWYSRDVHAVAHDLLGAYLTSRSPEGDVTVRLTEVEAYAGAEDPGSHAFRGRTPRTAVMFGEPGRLYVYRHLGLHHCVNVVAEPAGRASAVLLRAGQVVEGVGLARARREAVGVVDSEAHRQESSGLPPIASGPRVGVSGSGADAGRFPWRYWLTGDPTVSAYRPAYRPPASVDVP